jgi:hypothetical protein
MAQPMEQVAAVEVAVAAVEVAVAAVALEPSDNTITIDSRI